MIVVHNNSKPDEVSELLNSTIVDSDGKELERYKAYHVSSTVTWPDPSAYNEAHTEDVNNLSEARFDVVNHAKVPDIAIGSPSSTLLEYVAKTGESNLLITSPFGNWRDYSTNGFCTVSERVLLNPTNLNFSNGVSYSLTNIKSMLGKGSMKFIKESMDTINAIDEAFGNDKAEQGEYLSKFQNVPVSNAASTTTSGISELTFTFKFGQAQIFSAEEEVVKPILALANIFMPRQSGSSNRITTPFMTEIRARTQMMAACLRHLGNGGLKDLLGSVSDAPNGADIMNGNFNHMKLDDVLERTNGLTSKVFNSIDEAAKKALSETITIILNIGGYVTGPYIAKDISWSFDFSDVDEFGYPCSGQIKLGGLAQVFVNCSDDVIRQWGYTTGEASPYTNASPIKNSESSNFGNDSLISGTKTDLIGNF